MKKTLALILAIVMALGCFGITAFAADNESLITATVSERELEYTIIIPTTTTLTEENHTDVLLGTDGIASVEIIANPSDKVNISYTERRMFYGSRTSQRTKRGIQSRYLLHR